MNDIVLKLYMEFFIEKWPFNKLSAVDYNRQGWGISMGNTYVESRIPLQEFIYKLSDGQIVLHPDKRCYSPEYLPR